MYNIPESNSKIFIFSKYLLKVSRYYVENIFQTWIDIMFVQQYFQMICRLFTYEYLKILIDIILWKYILIMYWQQNLFQYFQPKNVQNMTIKYAVVWKYCMKLKMLLLKILLVLEWRIKMNESPPSLEPNQCIIFQFIIDII